MLDVVDARLSARKGLLVVRAGKGDFYREVPLNKPVRDALEAWLKERAATTSRSPAAPHRPRQSPTRPQRLPRAQRDADRRGLTRFSERTLHRPQADQIGAAAVMRARAVSTREADRSHQRGYSREPAANSARSTTTAMRSPRTEYPGGSGRMRCLPGRSPSRAFFQCSIIVAMQTPLRVRRDPPGAGPGTRSAIARDSRPGESSSRGDGLAPCLLAITR
jgi:hypothetical protein